MKKFELNGKKYTVVPMTFNTVCSLEEQGISLEEFSNKKLSFLRAYVAIAANIDADEAGIEIERHLKEGGNLNGIYELIGEQIEESDFFQSLAKTTEEETPKMAK